MSARELAALFTFLVLAALVAAYLRQRHLRRRERSSHQELERRTHDALRRQIDFSRMLVDSSLDGILAFDRSYRYTLWNPAMEQLTGVPRSEVIGRSAFEVFPFLNEIGEDRFFDEALAGRDAVSTDRRFEVLATKREGFFESRYSPLHGTDGDVVGGFAIVRDITDRKRAEEERERRRREEFARVEAEARNRMTQNLQTVTDTALSHLTADAMVGELLGRIPDMLGMDMAALALLDEDDRTLTIQAVTGIDAEAAEGIRIPVGQALAGRVAAERRPIAAESLTSADTVSPVLHDQGIRSLLGVPLLVGGNAVGVLCVGSRRPHSFSLADTGWLQLVGDRLALALEHASIYEREHQIAETLQRSLLPERLPEVASITVAARYLAGGAGAVGGDWYDIVPLRRGRVGLAMGDVAGHGVNAASLMGQMRSALRAYALEDPSPASVLRRLDRLLQSMGPSGMATLLYMVFDPNQREVRIASAGHLPPLLRGPDGSVGFLHETASVPLGVQTGALFDDRRFEFPPDATLVLYTDGLVERRGAPLEEGMRALEDALAHAPEAAEDVCDHLLRELLPDDPEDDTAVLVVHRATEPAERLRLRPPAEPRSLKTVRNALRRWLGQAGIDERETYEILVACGEACANAIEHAYGPGEAFFEVDAAMEDGGVAISVRDFGRWRAPRGEERGRGLDLMRQLMDTAEVTHTDDGTTVRLARALGEEAVD